MSLSPNN